MGEGWKEAWETARYVRAETPVKNIRSEYIAQRLLESPQLLRMHGWECGVRVPLGTYEDPSLSPLQSAYFFCAIIME